MDGAGGAADEDVEGRGGLGLRGRCAEASGFQSCRKQDGFELSGADYGVDFGDVAADLVAVALDEAAGDNELAGRTGGLEAGHFEDGVDGFLLGRVDEATGVDDEDLGFFWVRGEACAGAVEQAHHDLGVDEVLGAA